MQFHDVRVMSLLLLCLQIVFQNPVGKYELEVTTFQMAVLFAWNQRPEDKISFESLRYWKPRSGL